MEREPLLKWMREHVDDNYARGVFARDAAIDQMCFFRDYIARLFWTPDEVPESGPMFCKIEGWHTSKSVTLPVYYVGTPTIEVVARNNFHNWNVTVRAAKPIVLPDYFDVDAYTGYLFMEGMEHWKERPYLEDAQRFSIALYDRYQLFAVMWCIASQVK